MDAILRLRVAVWAAEGVDITPNGSGALQHEPCDPDAAHVVCVDGDSVVAAVRLTVHDALASSPIPPELRVPLPGPFALLSRLVVHPSHQGCGLGHSMVSRAIEEAESLHLRSVVAYTTVAGMGRNLRKRGFTSLAEADVTWGDRRFPAELFSKPRGDRTT